MAFNFRDLNDDTRRFMIEEIQAAIPEDNLYISKRFNQAGHDDYQCCYWKQQRGTMRIGLHTNSKREVLSKS